MAHGLTGWLHPGHDGYHVERLSWDLGAAYLWRARLEASTTYSLPASTVRLEIHGKVRGSLISRSRCARIYRSTVRSNFL